MKIVFMGSPPFSVPSLEALHASTHNIVAVVTQPDRPQGRNLRPQPPAVKAAAHRLQIPVFQPETTKTKQFLDEITAFAPDVLVVVAYGEILRKELLEMPAHGAVNLHASLLPKYRGAAPIAWAILNGETETGVTTMLMNEAMDAGPILLQRACPIDAAETTESLTTKLAALGAPLLRSTIDLLEKGDLHPKQQDLTKVTYAPKLKKEDGAVDWSRPADFISRQIRAFNPWPGTFTFLNGMLLKLWLAHQDESNTSEAPGTVLQADRQGLLVACGEGTVLRIIDVQPENKTTLTAGDFLRGYRISRGALFTANR